MYLDKENKEIVLSETPEVDRDDCMECGKDPVIIWKPAVWGTILLCAECAQVIGTHMIKDVRSFELDNSFSVKVKADLLRK